VDTAIIGWMAKLPEWRHADRKTQKKL
jgi:hypothetical protein